MTTNAAAGHDAQLLESLLAELFQSERSASRHPVVEADRLGDAPPALPMQLVAAHATRALSELELLAAARNIQVGATTKKVGRGFSAIRNRFADLVLRREQSYRFTILGIRHGFDLVRELKTLATKLEDTEFERWADQWLEERGQLVSQAEQELRWFVQFPETALLPVKDTATARAARTVASWYGDLDAALSRVGPKRSLGH